MLLLQKSQDFSSNAVKIHVIFSFLKNKNIVKYLVKKAKVLGQGLAVAKNGSVTGLTVLSSVLVQAGNINITILIYKFRQNKLMDLIHDNQA